LATKLLQLLFLVSQKLVGENDFEEHLTQTSLKRSEKAYSTNSTR